MWFTRRDIRREEEKYGKGRKDLRQEVKRERGRGSRQRNEQGRKGGREMGKGDKTKNLPNSRFIGFRDLN